ncbi:MAG: glycosyltransferase family 39 protein, partial [Deltaproteobacteria bacterium]|nr:glycosyltransferase family 39 protein [Deltaproteobacteria bacterium]
EYARLANALANGNFTSFVQENYITSFNAPAHLPYRMALIAPLAVIFRVFGINEASLAAYPFLLSLAGIPLAYLTGRLLFGGRAGLIAALLWAIFPVDVWYATSFLPDIIASFYGSAGVAVILWLIYSDKHFSGSRLFIGGAFAGLLFGLSWLSKESIAYLVPFTGMMMILSFIRGGFRSYLPLWIGVAIASGAMLLCEMAVYHYIRGDFMLRMHENERSFMQTKAYLFYEGSRFGWPAGASHAKALVKRLFVSGPTTILFNDRYLYLPFIGLIASAYGLYWRDKRFAFPALWLITLVLMYNFFTCSFASYTPLVLLERYLHQIMLPATLLTAGLIVKLFPGSGDGIGTDATRERLFWGLTVTSIVIAISGYTTFYTLKGMERSRPAYELKNAVKLIKPSDTVYTDPLTAKSIEFFQGYPANPNVVNFEEMKTIDVPVNSLVLVDAFRMDWLKVNVSMWLTHDYGYKEPEFAADPPANWKRLWKNAYATLYRVEGPSAAQ